MLVSEYQHKRKLDVGRCGPYKVLEVLNKGENVELDIPAPFDRMHVFNRTSIKPYIRQEGQPVWEFIMPPVKTGASLRLVKILARRRVPSKGRRTFLYCCEWDDDRWSWEWTKALEEDPLEFLQLHPDYLHLFTACIFRNSCEGSDRLPEPPRHVQSTAQPPRHPELPLDPHPLEHHRRTSSMFMSRMTMATTMATPPKLQ